MLPYHKSTEYASREEWLQARTAGIGGSDAPAVLKQSTWATPYSVWAEKRGLIKPEQIENQRLLIGHVLEPAIAKLYELETGDETHDPGDFRIFEGEERFQIATLDRMSDRVPIVELKTAGNSRDWKNGPPLNYQIQVQHQMAVMEADRAVIACLFGSPTFHFAAFEIERNTRFITAMTKAERAFWDMVQNEEAPEIDDSDVTRAALQRFPFEKGKAIDLPGDFGPLDIRREKVKRLIQRLTRIQTGIENQIKALMGDAEIGLLSGRPAFTWKGDSKGTRRFLSVLKGEVA